jgi:transposase
MSNNAVERAVRGIGVRRRSDTDGSRRVAIYTLIEACKPNGIDPRAWLADVLARVPDHPAKSITELLPWQRRTVTAAA